MNPEFSSKRCASCGERLDDKADLRLLPFCSSRCKLVDLGKWFSEEYSVATNETSEDEYPLDQEENEDN